MADIITAMSGVVTMVINTFKMVLNTIVAEPLLLAPIIIGLFGGVVLFAIKKVRSMGVRAGGGGRRRRR